MLTTIVTTGLGVFLAVLFGSTGFGKITRPVDYAESVAAYVGRSVPGVTIQALGVVECVIAVLVLLPASYTAGAVAAAGLLAVYGIAMARLVSAGRRDVRCGCAGPASETRVSPELIARNGVVALAVLMTLMLPDAAGVSAVGLLTGIVFGAVLALSYTAMDLSLALRQNLQEVR